MKSLIIVLIASIAFAASVSAQTTAFTYQGRLTDSSAQANGTYDLGFALFDAAAGGTQIGAALTRPTVTVTSGAFTVQLDFGAAAFPGANRFLEIAVKKPSDANFTTLMPRQSITSTPYAVRALSAATADRATTATTADNLSAAGASNFVGTNDARLTDSRAPSAGSTFYIQNQNAAAQTADFNLSATGAANILDAATQFNIGGTRVLITAGLSNLFAGADAGTSNIPTNYSGRGNSFFGSSAGSGNTSGNDNTFVGSRAGGSSTTSSSNSFVGVSAGVNNTTGSNNAFFGSNAGYFSEIGTNNVFVGADTGFSNTTGSRNAFIGSGAGNNNSTGSNNTLIGQDTNLLGSGSRTYATAIGSGSSVSTDNTVALGRSNGLDKVVVYGLGVANTNVTLCRNSLNQIATCNSSAFVTAAKETADSTAAELAAQKLLNERQQREINELKQIVCSLKPDAQICGGIK